MSSILHDWDSNPLESLADNKSNKQQQVTDLDLFDFGDDTSLLSKQYTKANT